MGRSPRTLVASYRRARRRVGDALWAAGYPARRGLHSARARLAGWRRGRTDALVPLQLRWPGASGERRAAAAVLALLPLSLAAVMGVSLFHSAEREPRSAPEAVRVSDGVLPEAVERRPAREPKPSRRRPHKAAPGPAAAGPAGVGVRSAATGLASAPGAPSLAAPDGAPDAGVAPDARGAPNDSPSPPRDFDSGGRPNVGPRAHAPFGGGPGTREPSGGAPRPGAPSGEHGAAPQPAPVPPPAVPPAEVPATEPIGTTPEVPEPDEDGGPGRGNGPPVGGPPGQGGGDGDKPDED
jgi:hypothetical protein